LDVPLRPVPGRQHRPLAEVAGSPEAEVVRAFTERWKRDARCRGADPAKWFPGAHESAAEAKRICAECPVQVDCLEYALANGEKFGIWAGTNKDDRRRILADRVTPGTPRHAGADP
jgi:WhiB family transcriptional regulator, redox-sensing transcriptional regulator